jgi:hypothetical protein
MGHTTNTNGLPLGDARRAEYVFSRHVEIKNSAKTKKPVTVAAS